MVAGMKRYTDGLEKRISALESALAAKDKKLEEANSVLLQQCAINRKLSEELNEIHGVWANVMGEKCPNDELHCGCVPILRDTIAKYAAMVDQKEQERDRLRTELEAKRLRWQTGTVPETGNYVIDRTDMYAMQFFVRLFQGQNPNCKWAGPIVVED